MAKPKKTNPVVAGAGAAVGAMLGGPMGAILGAGIGALLGEEEQSLSDALQAALADQGLTLVSVRSPTRHSANITYRKTDGSYDTIAVAVETRVDDVEGALFDQAIKKLTPRKLQHAR